MGLFAGILRNISIHDKTDSALANYIFYKIVDSIPDTNIYYFQCINTSVIFRVEISSLLTEMDIVLGLHPIQACYIGIEYATRIGLSKINNTLGAAEQFDLSGNRYGRYKIKYLDRKENVVFECNQTQQILSLDATMISRSKELIQEFDAGEAFYIGFLSGNKMKIMQANTKPYSQVDEYLRLVK